jgi:phosphoserine phosphatase
MYLHLGGDTAVDMKDVVAVFDMDNTTVSQRSRKFLAAAEKRGEIVDITEDLPKSYIITASGGKNRIYISSLAPQTLVKRVKAKGKK